MSRTTAELDLFLHNVGKGVERARAVRTLGGVRSNGNVLLEGFKEDLAPVFDNRCHGLPASETLLERSETLVDGDLSSFKECK